MLGPRFSRLFTALLSLLLTLLIVIGCVYFYMMVSLPSVAVLNDMRMQIPLSIYTSDQKLIAIYGEKRRIPITLDQAPPLLVKAILATEDKRYYDHPGVDIVGLGRATLSLVMTGKKSQGASTITMQVARNFFLTRKKTYGRKIKEILLAIKISQVFSKQKVLELYLNKIYLGHRAYGVAAAAQVYYDKSLSQLTVAELAMLAGLPQAPSRENPITNPALAEKRRNHVLQRMFEAGDIDISTYQQALAAPAATTYHGLKIDLQAPYVADMVNREMLKRYGQQAYSKGIKVITTISSDLQRASNTSVTDGVLAYDRRHGYRGPITHWRVDTSDPETFAWMDALSKMPKRSDMVQALVWQVDDQSVIARLADGQQVDIPWANLSWARRALGDGQLGSKPTQASDIVRVGDVVWVQKTRWSWRLAQPPNIQAALVAINAHDGAILALNGGYSFQQSHFNRSVQAKRQPGSSFKPFIYAAALAKGFTLATVFNDAPVVTSDREDVLWRPQNDQQRFYGPTRLRLGLEKSRNAVTVRLLQAIGLPFAQSYLKHFDFEQHTVPNDLTLALGSGVITPLDLTRAYAVFANGGYAISPYLIEHVVLSQGDQTNDPHQPLLACDDCAKAPQLAPRVISPDVAYLMDSALKSVVTHGTGRRALALKRSDVAGKTGTTETDGWFVGYGGGVVTTVWMGFDQSIPLLAYGSQTALPIWIDFMRAATKSRPMVSLTQPSDIVSVRIDPATGLIARPGESDMFELFRKAHAPAAYSNAPSDGASATQSYDSAPIF